jgi:hypothetical protein
MKKEKTAERKLKIMALGMSLIVLSLIILALPVSTGMATENGATMVSQASQIAPNIQERTGNISAISEPPAADVYLDYEYVGTTPVVFNASAGYHSIDFKKEGYYSDYQYISVIPGETVKVEGELMWMGADVILGVVIILIPLILIILFFYYLFRRSKKNNEYCLEQGKKIERLDSDSYLMRADINNIEIELKRSAEFIDAQPRENPYVAGGAVDDPRFWLGNEDLINRVLTSISRNHFFIRGERRSGKTTLLMRISRALGMKTYPEVSFIPVYLSLQGIPPEMFFKRLYKAIVSKVNIPESDIEEPEEIVDAEDFINAMSYIIESLNNSSSTKSVIVLLLDEIELFNTYPLDLRESFRTVFMGPPEFSEYLRLIVTGTEIEVWTRSSPMNYLIETEIEPLTAEEARAMILMPAKGFANFDDAAVDKIIEVSNYRPYKIQKICEQLIDTAIQKRVYRIKEEDVDELINSLEFKEGSK